MNPKSEAQKAEYHWFKAHGICVKCRRRDAVKGRVMCASCAAHEREVNRKRRQNATPEEKAKARAYLAARHERMRAQGLCVACGKHPARPERTECQACADYRKIKKLRSETK